MIIGSIFFINMFIGVVQNTFKSEHDRAGGDQLLTDKQKEWIELKLLVLRSAPFAEPKPPAGSGCFRLSLYKFATHSYFERFIQLSIFLNTVVLTNKWYRQPSNIDLATGYLDIVFTVIFISEAIIRLTGLGYQNYFKESWNVYDCVIAFGSGLALIITRNADLKIKGTTLLRAFRMLRLLRLLKRGGQGLNHIFNTFVFTMQSLANIGGLLLLFMYMYGIVGVIYFGEVMRTGNMNDYINFESFSNAFVTLFTVATADSWNYTMASFTKSHAPAYDCLDDPDYSIYVENGYRTVGCGSR
jgi:hypothetical protein